MLKTRVIPLLLLRDGGLYKGRRFKDHRYVGDPLNTIRLFNDMEVDELVILDIGATPAGRKPDYDLLEEAASEAFMPMAYGGGIRSTEEMQRILALGFEKIVINTAAIENPALIREAAERFGSQSVVVSIDAKRGFFGGYRAVTHCGSRVTRLNPFEASQLAVNNGAGEILMTSVDRDGAMAGFDIQLINAVAPDCPVPFVAAGGAGSMDDLRKARDAGASGIAAGSFFLFQGPHRAVLISYPKYADLEALFKD